MHGDNDKVIDSCTNRGDAGLGPLGAPQGDKTCKKFRQLLLGKFSQILK